MKKLAYLLLSLFITGCFVDPTPVKPLEDALDITAISPHLAKAAQKIVVSGKGFKGVTEVTVGGKKAEVLTNTDTAIEISLPKLDAGSFKITVIKGDKSDTYSNIVVLETENSRPPVTGPITLENNPGYIQGELMVSFPGTFTNLEALQKELSARQTSLKVTKFIPAIVPNSQGMCGKSFAVLEIPEGESKQDTAKVLEEFRRLYPELKDLEWWGDAHTADLGDQTELEKQARSFPSDSAPSNFKDGWGWQVSSVPSGPTLTQFANGLKSIKVAVLDTGISSHEEFYRGEVNTVIDYANGRDFTTDNPQLANLKDTFPEIGSRIANGHGTGVAAIIGALNYNQYPAVEGSQLFSTMIGVSPEVQIVPIKVCEAQVFFGQNKTLKYSALCKGISVAAGICHAIAKNVKVINMSLGGPLSSPIIHGVLAEAAKAGISIVTSAGNNPSDKFHYPATYAQTLPGAHDSIPGLIAVGAIGQLYDGIGTIGLADYSTRGSWVDVVAPGGGYECQPTSAFNCIPGPGIFTATSRFDGSTDPQSYNYMIGTSFAAPFVTGTAALLLAQNPSLTPEAIKAKIKLSGLVMPEGCTSSICGAGLLDVSKSLGLTATGRP
jgi:hypothetical protein